MCSETSINQDSFVFVELYDKNLGIIVCNRALAGRYRTFGPCVFLNRKVHRPCGPWEHISESWDPLMGF